MMLSHVVQSFFYVDALASVMIILVGFIGIVVLTFSIRYMQGDRHYFRFLILLLFMIISVMLMVASDHLGVLLATWGLSNLWLLQLMVHKPQWKAALQSGWLTAKAFLVGFVSLALGCGMLYYLTGQTSIQTILHSVNVTSEEPWIIAPTLFILVAAMSQSAIWPFQRWLVSSLNSPTPVSAMMHAGLVNGGGFLLARFAPLIASKPEILNIIFILGLATALLGTVWKLMQNDVKRMLACSTLGQMGFMFLQCGLGLFPAAVTHLCWHGLFKANLFLGFPTVAKQKRLLLQTPTLFTFVLALCCGVLGSYTFALAGHIPWGVHDTTFMLVGLSFIAASQVALTLLSTKAFRRFLLAMSLTGLMGWAYGMSIYLIKSAFSSVDLMFAQPLQVLHVVALGLLMLLWVMMVFNDRLNQRSQLIPWFYVKVLNASQPHPATITTHRQYYHYK